MIIGMQLYVKQQTVIRCGTSSLTPDKYDFYSSKQFFNFFILT